MPVSEPQFHPLEQPRRQLGLDDAPHLLRVVARAEVAQMISSFWKRSARSMKSSRCMWPNLWIFSRRWFGRMKLSSVMRIFASYTAG